MQLLISTLRLDAHVVVGGTLILKSYVVKTFVSGEVERFHRKARQLVTATGTDVSATVCGMMETETMHEYEGPTHPSLCTLHSTACLHAA